jgi:hypothetical protein
VNAKQLEAHLKLLALLPTRTHRCAHDDPRMMRDLPPLPARLVDAFRRMYVDRCTTREIRAELHIGQSTYRRLVALIKSEKK